MGKLDTYELLSLDAIGLETHLTIFLSSVRWFHKYSNEASIKESFGGEPDWTGWGMTLVSCRRRERGCKREGKREKEEKRKKRERKDFFFLYISCIYVYFVKFYVTHPPKK